MCNILIGAYCTGMKMTNEMLSYQGKKLNNILFLAQTMQMQFKHRPPAF